MTGTQATQQAPEQAQAYPIEPDTGKKKFTRTKGEKRKKSEKGKTKRRGQLQTGPQGSRSKTNEQETQDDTLKKIPVDDQALQTLQFFFHSQNRGARPGEVEWKDILHAMAAAGCSTTRLKRGVTWQFQITGLDGKKEQVQFHEPHGDGKLRIREARKYGRRLRETFGWDSETFVLAE